jgi:hypothetical protein
MHWIDNLLTTQISIWVRYLARDMWDQRCLVLVAMPLIYSDPDLDL